MLRCVQWITSTPTLPFADSIWPSVPSLQPLHMFSVQPCGICPGSSITSTCWSRDSGSTCLDSARSSAASSVWLGGHGTTRTTVPTVMETLGIRGGIHQMGERESLPIKRCPHQAESDQKVSSYQQVWAVNLLSLLRIY